MIWLALVFVVIPILFSAAFVILRTIHAGEVARFEAAWGVR